ncbi:glycosyltransferase family 4 protein [Treponema brennaborense]|nr:glycosyltransferase family 1 protein [Treponema brennaborense]
MIDSGGIGSYISSLLPYFVNQNECLLIGARTELEQFAARKNVSIVECDIRPFSVCDLFFFPYSIKKRIRTCDVFYSPYCNIPLHLKIPVFSTIHDVVFLDVPGLVSKIGTFLRKVLYLYAVRQSNVIFTVSQFSAERIRFHLNCKKRIVVTYNAVPPWLLEAAETAVPSDKENFFLFVGNIKKHKGLSVLLNAFIQAQQQGVSAKLLIVGNADNFRTKDESVFDKVALAARGSVEFTGKISDLQLKNLYKRARLLVQPSFYEGFGMPPLEALSLGTPAVISDIPVFREIYGDFPVIFFRTGDSDDLAKKLIDSERCSMERTDIPRIYSFERTARIIQRTLEEFHESSNRT